MLSLALTASSRATPAARSSLPTNSTRVRGRNLIDDPPIRACAATDHECLALNRLATFAARADFDLGGALGLLEQAQVAAERCGEQRDQAETYWNLAQIGYYARDLEAGRAHAEEAAVLARDIGIRNCWAAAST